MLFWRKTDETIWKPLFLRETPLSTNPPISEQFFHVPTFCPNFRNKKSPLILGSGRKLWIIMINKFQEYPIIRELNYTLLQFLQFYYNWGLCLKQENQTHILLYQVWSCIVVSKSFLSLETVKEFSVSRAYSTKNKICYKHFFKYFA